MQWYITDVDLNKYHCHTHVNVFLGMLLTSGHSKKNRGRKGYHKKDNIFVKTMATWNQTQVSISSALSPAFSAMFAWIKDFNASFASPIYVNYVTPEKILNVQFQYWKSFKILNDTKPALQRRQLLQLPILGVLPLRPPC